MASDIGGEFFGQYDARFQSVMREVRPNEVVQNSSITAINALINSIDMVNAIDYPKSARNVQIHRLNILYPWLQYGLDVCVAENTPAMEEFVDLTTLVLEMSQVDEVKGYGRTTAYKSVAFDLTTTYGREDVTKLPFLLGGKSLASPQFFTREELSYIFSHKDDMVIPKNKQEFYSLLTAEPSDEMKKKNLAFPLEFASIDAFEAFMKNIQQRADKRSSAFNCSTINVRVRLSDDIGIWYQLYNDGTKSTSYYELAHVQYERGDEYKLTQIPKSDIFRAYISAGYWDRSSGMSAQDLIRANQSTVVTSMNNIGIPAVRRAVKERVRDVMQDASYTPQDFLALLLDRERSGFETWQWNLARKKQVKHGAHDLMSGERRRMVNDSVIAKHSFVYERLFMDEQTDVRPDVYFTRSGISANEAALMVAKNVLTAAGQHLRVAEMDGWYYETHAPESWIKTDVDIATLLLVPVEPNPPMFMDKEAFEKQRSGVIQEFLTSVRADPDKPFVLIADKTTDLLDHKYFPKDSIPPNLLVIETASLTKHQRGGRANFFGSLAFWAPVDPTVVKESITAVAGELTSEGMYALPRLTRGEIEETIKHNKLLSDIMTDAFDQAQKDLPEDLKWHWESYSHAGFITPPIRYLETNRGHRSIDGNIVQDAVDAFGFKHPEVRLEKGDSFGLSTIRAITFTVWYPSTSDKKKRARVMRISFGLETTATEMREFAQYMAHKLAIKR